MRLAGKVARVAVFLGVVLLVVVGSTAGSFLADVGGSPPDPAEYSEYNASSIVPDRAESGGTPSVEPAGDEGLVVVDLAHSNRFRPDEIQPLASAIAGTGYEIEFVRDRGDLEDALARADAFVVIDPGVSYTTHEAELVESFVEGGGRLALLGEPTHLSAVEGDFGTSLSPVHNRLDSLSTQFGIEFGAGYLYNMERNDGNFRSVVVNGTGDGPLVDGVESAVFQVATPVEGPDAEPVLVATDGTRSAETDGAGEFAVAARAGNVVAVGDTSFLRDDSSDVLDTDAFVGNLATFLASGERERTLGEYPAVVPADATVGYTQPALLDAAQTLRSDLPGRATVSVSRNDPGGVDVLVTTFDFLAENDVAGTGIDTSGDRVSVPGYRGGTAGVAVVRAPADGEVDLVIAANGPSLAAEAVDLLAADGVDQYALDDRTVVIRSSASASGDDTTGG